MNEQNSFRLEIFRQKLKMIKVDLNTIIQSYPSYQAFLDAEYIAKIAEMKTRENSLEEEEKTLLSTITGYYKEIQQILTNYTPSAEITAAAQKVSKPIDVYMIAENWCGTSMAALPYIVKILATNKNFNLMVVLRDSNPDFMNLYLSPTGGKSIPKVIGVNKQGEEVIDWGSSSKAEAIKRQELLAEGDERPVFIKKLNDWYIENNLKAIENDFIEVFANMN